MTFSHDWKLLDKIHHALYIELAAGAERRAFNSEGLPTISKSECVEDIRYAHPGGLLPGTLLRLASCTWVENASNVILGKTSVRQFILAEALVNAACRKDYTVGYWRLMIWATG